MTCALRSSNEESTRSASRLGQVDVPAGRRRVRLLEADPQRQPAALLGLPPASMLHRDAPHHPR
jgi:hypothetical protein